MNREYFVQLYEYTDWANRRVWDCVMKATDEDYFADQTFSVGSLFIQLTHTLDVERWWLNYLANGTELFISEEELEQYKDRDKLRALWDTTNANNMAYLLTLTDYELQRMVKPNFWGDKRSAISVSQALAQVVNHSTDHRAQTMAILHTMGYEGVGQDFLTYLHEL